MSLSRRYVEPAACVTELRGGSKIATSCALEPQWCKDTNHIVGAVSTTFVSSRQLHAAGSNAPGYACLSSNGNDPKTFAYLGRCASPMDEYVCTSRAENCKAPTTFEPFADRCTLLADLAPNRIQPRSFFSSCQTPSEAFERRCFWSATECTALGDEGYISFGAMPYNYNVACSCEDTEVGACQTIGADGNRTSEYHCAVSESGCDSGSVFVPVQELQDTAGMDCRLCQEPSSIPEPVVLPSDNGNGNDDGGTQKSPNEDAPADSSKNSGGGDGGQPNGNNDKDNQEAIILGSIIGGVAIGLILAFVCFLVLRRRRNRKSQTKGGTAIVVELASADNQSSSASAGPEDTVSAAGSSTPSEVM
ncbi:hypothetical protein ACA910_021223 [Epithemia clementina (nom. ined.)]